MSPVNFEQILDKLRSDQSISQNIVHWQTLDPKPGSFADYPDFLNPRLVETLKKRGLDQLYIHQRLALDSLSGGADTVVVTPTASGKTLCYNLPVLNTIMDNPASRALYLFPTKALGQDQTTGLSSLIDDLGVDIKTYTFDGDTPQNVRRAIRSAGHIVITNPDMLHSGILPHHTRWIKLFENLKFVVIDEVHHYRGVFGSHLANVIRRLRRICEFYGSDPVFALSSATIANPDELASRIIGRPVRLIDENGAPSGEKHFIIYNPPVVEPRLGIRRSAVNEARRLAEWFLREKIQTIIFAHSRTRVEELLVYLKQSVGKAFDRGIKIAGYRGGYLPNERRKIEEGLRSGEITGVVSTNALELGMDIGSLDVSIIVGYPGSISSLWQQAGRAGRRKATSLTIFITNSSALNQFLGANPDYIFKKSPEMGIIDPDNLIIRTSHLKCASYELPMTTEENFGADGTTEILEYLEDHKVLRKSGKKFHWSSEIYPAEQVSLRSASPENFVIMNESDNHKVIGEVDYFSAPYFVHPEAIYIHNGETYQVTNLDWDGRKAYVKEVKVDYYTDAETKADLTVLRINESQSKGDSVINLGEVSIRWVTTMYKKIKFHSHENVGFGQLSLPEMEMNTEAFWYAFPEDLKDRMGFGGEETGAALRATANLLGKIAPLWVMCDPRDLRSISQLRAPFTELPTIYMYENVPGGVGLSEKLFTIRDELFGACLYHARHCGCENGCPSCVGPPLEIGENGKPGAIKLLEMMLSATTVQPVG
ncbi:MAG: DEAD/DEAH box helicase [candidate division Zixibacteria bacterium]|nr:DEAD/DEAH box helicase [candidate division Zixibacteria bacterium]